MLTFHYNKFITFGLLCFFYFLHTVKFISIIYFHKVVYKRKTYEMKKKKKRKSKPEHVFAWQCPESILHWHSYCDWFLLGQEHIDLPFGYILKNERNFIAMKNQHHNNTEEKPYLCIQVREIFKIEESPCKYDNYKTDLVKHNIVSEW